jgi:hypothetical protein
MHHTKVLPRASACQEKLWTEARGGDSPKPILIDRVLNAYRTAEGPFTAPPLPPRLLYNKHALATDSAMKKDQQLWSSVGFMLAKGLTNIEALVQSLRAWSDQGYVPTPQEISELTEVLAGEAVKPLGHAFRVVASTTNDIHQKRKVRVHSALASEDFTLAQSFQDNPLGMSTFCIKDMAGDIDKSKQHHRDKSLFKTLVASGKGDRPSQQQRAPQTQQPRGGQQGRSSHPNHHTPSTHHSSAASGRPFRGGRPGQRGGQRGSYRGRGKPYTKPQAPHTS